MEAIEKRHAQEEAESLARAKADAARRGKEPFDLEKPGRRAGGVGIKRTDGHTVSVIESQRRAPGRARNEIGLAD